jgi:aromatic ring hydroxylase
MKTTNKTDTGNFTTASSESSEETFAHDETGDNQTALRTSAEYRQALKNSHPSIIKDKLLAEPYEDEDIQKGVNVVALSYDCAQEEEYRDFMTVQSPITGKIINRYNHIPLTREDLKKKQRMIYTLAKKVFCAQRCVGSDALHTLHIGTYKLDKANKGETNYHERFLKYLEYIQNNDISPT